MKRKTISYSTSEKMLAITRVNNGETKAAVGRDMNVPESTLRGWCKDEKKIRKIYSLTLSSNGQDDNLSRQEPPTKRRRLDNGHSVSSTSNFKVLYKKYLVNELLEKLSENEVIRKLFAENEANGTQETDLLSAEWTLESRERLLDAAENLVTPSPASTSQINEKENGMVCEGPLFVRQLARYLHLTTYEDLQHLLKVAL